MKLNQNFIIHKVDGQTLIVPTGAAGFHGLVEGNKSFSAIAECLQKDTTEEEIVDILCMRFNADREIIAADVAEAISRLKAIGAIDDEKPLGLYHTRYSPSGPFCVSKRRNKR